MLGKLMKYEFMSMGRVFLPMYGALIAVTLISRLLMFLPHTAPMTISTVVASVMIAAVAVITLILIIQRFRKNLLSDEGYLMMTLPVNTGSLILSKMFVATIFATVSTLVSALAIFILASGDFIVIINELEVYLSNIEARHVLVTLQVFVIAILATFASILLLYTCMALSLFVNKRRGLMSFGAFVGITTIMQIIIAIVGATIAFHQMFDHSRFANMSDFAIGQAITLVIAIVMLIQCAVFYFITRYMLKRRLNLL